MKSTVFILFSAVFVLCSCQRSPYAGRRPIGYPAVEATTLVNALGNRFGENETTTTQRLPLEALGDRELVNRLGKLPQDKQPFWFINWQALEENRKKPQSFDLRPSVFAESIVPQNNNNQNIPQNGQNNQGSQPNLDVNRKQNFQPTVLTLSANQSTDSNRRPSFDSQILQQNLSRPSSQLDNVNLTSQVQRSRSATAANL